MKKSSEKIIAEAVRLEYDEKEDKLFIVFEITDPKSKLELKEKWASNDLEYKLIGNHLFENIENDN